MVQVSENWADLTGTVLAIQAHPDQSGQAVVRLDVASAADVETFPNFFTDYVGREVDVSVRADVPQLAALGPGDPVRLRARRGGSGRAFALDVARATET